MTRADDSDDSLARAARWCAARLTACDTLGDLEREWENTGDWPKSVAIVPNAYHTRRNQLIKGR